MLIKDQLHRTHNFSIPPSRIVSLVPSQSELLVDLGLMEQLVGITKFCVHPPQIKEQISIVGGTKKVHLDKIESLKPDIIICNKEENTKEMVLSLEKIAPVWISDIQNITDNNRMIEILGTLFAVSEKASSIISKIENAQSEFLKFIKNRTYRKVAYLIWKQPYMAVGANTFIDHMLSINHLENIFKNKNSRYPEVDIVELKSTDLLLLSTEPYPFNRNDLKSLKSDLGVDVLMVDGEYFSWYGSRLIRAFEYFKNLPI